MAFQTLIINKEDDIVTIVLNRPQQLNALNAQMLEELSAAFEQVSKDEKVRVVVLTGAGQAFCAGGDLTNFLNKMGGKTRDDLPELYKWIREVGYKAFIDLVKLNKPTIAMVNGPAVGGGLDLACGCDIRIGSEKARFAAPYVKLGIFCDDSGTWLLPRIIGLGNALELLYTADSINAEEAARIGLLNHLVSSDQLGTETMKLARRIARNAPMGLKFTKMHVYKGLSLDFETAMDLLGSTITVALASKDHQEGVAAFKEKRQPTFENK